MGVGLLAIPVVAIIALLAGSSSSSSSGTSPGGGGGGSKPPPLPDCTKAILGLPSTPGPGGGPSLRDMVNAAMIATDLPKEAYDTMANSLDELASKTTDPELKGNAQVAAQCLRARGATAGVGTPKTLPPDMTCETAIGLLPPDLQAQVIAARKAGTASDLGKVADTLDGLSLLQSDATVRTRMQLVAKCLRAGAPTPVPLPLPPPPAGGGGGTIVFDPSLVAARGGNGSKAHFAAIDIGTSKAVGVGAADTAADGTYRSLFAFSKYPPNAAKLVTLQRESGISPDGKYGLQTQRAFDWFWTHTS